MELHVPCVDQSFVGKKGMFYVGGKYSGPEGKHFLCNQMFVEVYVPKEIRYPYPVIMFHGGRPDKHELADDSRRQNGMG